MCQAGGDGGFAQDPRRRAHGGQAAVPMPRMQRALTETTRLPRREDGTCLDTINIIDINMKYYKWYVPVNVKYILIESSVWSACNGPSQKLHDCLAEKMVHRQHTDVMRESACVALCHNVYCLVCRQSVSTYVQHDLSNR
jgi:hypothetical protein